MSKQAIECVVVIYDFVDSKGVIKETHSCYDTDLQNVVVPEGWKLVRKPPLVGENSVPREVNYVVARMDEYPSIGDQLDVIWKMFAANPALLTPDAKAMLARINTTKATYVKGTTYVNNNGPEGNSYIPKA